MKSIIDTVISKETAKLFNKENYTYPVEYCWVGEKLIDINLLINEDNILKAPSLSMILKFLREERGIIITPVPVSGNKWMSEVYLQNNGKLILQDDSVYGNSWEEVVEEQIKNIYNE